MYTRTIAVKTQDICWPNKIKTIAWPSLNDTKAYTGNEPQFISYTFVHLQYTHNSAYGKTWTETQIQKPQITWCILNLMYRPIPFFT